MRDADIGTAIGSGSMRRVEIRLPEPSLEDQRADWERLAAGLGQKGITATLPDASSLERLSATGCQGYWPGHASRAPAACGLLIG